MKRIFLISAIFWTILIPLSAQITIGSGLKPLRGTLLDLKDDSNDGKTSTKGLMLPRVRLQNIYSLQMSESAPKLEDQETAHAGLMVYNANDSYPICKGVYVWDGGEWIPFRSCDMPSNGFGVLSGKMCYDVVESEASAACGAKSIRTSQKVDFSDRTIQDPKGATTNIPIPGTGKARYSGVQIYTFTASEAVQNISFFYKNPEGLNVIEKVEWDKVKGAGSFAKDDEMKVTVYFNQSLNSIAKGRSRTNPIQPQIAAIFTNKADNKKYMQEVIPSIQDCACCGALSTKNGGWIEFQCHNLGADESIDPLQFNPSIAFLGDLYQWGRPSDGHEKKNSPVARQKAENMETLATDETVKGKFMVTQPDFVINTTENRWKKTQKPNYDPCPEGWHIPSLKDIESILGSISISHKIEIPDAGVMLNGNMVKYDANNGLHIGDLLHFPNTGHRGPISGMVFPNEESHIWLNETAMDIYFGRPTPVGSIKLFKQPTTTYGFAVRCVGDN